MEVEEDKTNALASIVVMDTTIVVLRERPHRRRGYAMTSTFIAVKLLRYKPTTSRHSRVDVNNCRACGFFCVFKSVFLYLIDAKL